MADRESNQRPTAGVPKRELPRSFDLDQRNRYRELWHSQADNFSASSSLYSTDKIGPFLISEIADCVFGNSPYLSKVLIKHPEYVEKMAGLGPNEAWQHLIDELRIRVFGDTVNVSQLMESLRRYKQIASLHIAICDVTQLWSLNEVVSRLSELADICVKATLHNLLIAEAKKGELAVEDEKYPFSGSGIFVLALGKLGAHELNYSSDIDLMFLFDHEIMPYTGRKTAHELAIRLAKNLIKVLDERTPDGYVFRTDMRLRPDPSSTSIAVSTESAELYYESWGQNWERAALIKARCIAGDINAARSFLTNLEPFVWRKSLDFYAIQDIHSVKRQIYAFKGGASINVMGHDIKTGRGGIREIEFFVQIQQLIWGGRNPLLRSPHTLNGLRDLYAEGLISNDAYEELTRSYEFLRRLEHHLQMINDEQTQKIPTDFHKAEAISCFIGYDDFSCFESDVTKHLRLVESHYADLFEDSPALTVDGNLVFTGTDHDPDTLETLGRMGYKNPSVVSQVIRSWHHGIFRATRSTRSRQILTELLPALLLAFAKTRQPDRAFINFDQSLSKLPAGVQLFSVFYANPEILDLIAEIMGDAPRLANYLTASTQRLDYVLDPGFFNEFPPHDVLLSELSNRMSRLNNLEEKLESCVGWTNDLRFRTGVLVLRKIITPYDGSKTLTSIADVVIQSLVPVVTKEFESRFGVIKSSSLAILAYGKLGSGELMPSSDLDLVIIYDAKADAHAVETDRSLPASAYFIRLAQRIVSALTLMTSEGRLFEVDLRLRPSGAQGPFASNLESFKKYQSSEAWIWEHLALTKARVVYATDDIAFQIEKTIDDALRTKREKRDIGKAIAQMRTRIRKERGQRGFWDIKNMEGGLSDTEFLIQFHALGNDNFGKRKRTTETIEVINSLVKAGEISPEDAATLKSSYKLWLTILWLLRLCLDQASTIDDVAEGLEARLIEATLSHDKNGLEKVMLDTRQQISRLVERDISIY
jgi:[glutamine synthetase] adenylyltransferase / [glutamine synthetase]-adenylyl-L-tyrosine phosphorylase